MTDNFKIIKEALMCSHSTESPDYCDCPTKQESLAALAEIKAEREWQPIEIAPKDGTRIIAYRPFAPETNDPTIDIVGTTNTPRMTPQGSQLHGQSMLSHALDALASTTAKRRGPSRYQ